ncbi:hypothetical protein [uncultured Alistipes sp.]|uniref:hypothetical protein n=1 Tax=uncultured Alistipes sp. TaxID=538949 RepID=UPI0032206758
MSQTNSQIDTEIEMPHGLLAEDFKQNLLMLVQNHKLDIQTKAIILDAILLSVNMIAKQQTTFELNEYQSKLNAQKTKEIQKEETS